MPITSNSLEEPGLGIVNPVSCPVPLSTDSLLSVKRRRFSHSIIDSSLSVPIRLIFPFTSWVIFNGFSLPVSGLSSVSRPDWLERFAQALIVSSIFLTVTGKDASFVCSIIPKCPENFARGG